MVLLALACRAELQPASQLAEELFAEARWSDCRTECLRLLLGNPESDEIRLLAALALLRLGEGGNSELVPLLGSNLPGVRELAGYEMGREHWRNGEHELAFKRLHSVFTTTGSEKLFLRTSCSLWFMLQEQPTLAEDSPQLLAQLKTAAPLWTAKLRAECARGRKPRAAFSGKPGLWIINLYRSQVAPAIGNRCSLHPSCSAYGKEALTRHGMLGFALIGDRAVREPDVVAARQSPVYLGGQTRYADPLDNHDGWLRKKDTP